jgi:hypothetical protein
MAKQSPNAKNGAKGKDLPGGDPNPLLPVRPTEGGYGASADDIARGYKVVSPNDTGGDPRIGPWPYHDRDGVIFIRGRDNI